jgi:hypothetical protein
MIAGIAWSRAATRGISHIADGGEEKKWKKSKWEKSKRVGVDYLKRRSPECGVAITLVTQP